jgi:two-component system, NarL family, nitrate/nitrite sensor histidine kinase NarX
MRKTASVSTKLIRIGASLLVVALASIGLTFWVTWQLAGGAAAVNEAGRMRMQTWQLHSAVQTQRPATEIEALVLRFDHSLTLLGQGDPRRPLFVPWDDQTRQRFAQVHALWEERRAFWQAGFVMAPPFSFESAADFVEATDAFVMAIEHQLSRWTAILNAFQIVMMLLAIAGAVIMLYTGYVYVINPLESLSRGLQRLKSGDFSTRIQVNTHDEFGQVAAGFNRMAATLQSLYLHLESKVDEKTRQLETKRARLQALYDISTFLGEANALEPLCRGFAQRLQSVMQADAIALRWSEESQQRYLLLASEGLPETIREQERCLLSGLCACGNLKPESRTRVLPIHGHEGPLMRQCAEAGFETMISVPVRLQHRILGEINLFFCRFVALHTDQTEWLDALASHFAGALEGMRAAALEREAVMAEERGFLARELHDSIAQSLSFLKIQVQLLRTAMEREDQSKMQVALNELDDGLRESIGDVRELLVHFRTRANSEQIEAALQETLKKFEHQTGLPTQLDIQGDAVPLPADVQIQILHVIQEALSNVRKHAKASQITLALEKGALWRFTVRDNGIGFDPEQTRGETHVGLKIMKERADSIGAWIEIRSAAGMGTALSLTLPPHPVGVVGCPQNRPLSTPAGFSRLF